MLGTRMKVKLLVVPLWLALLAACAGGLSFRKKADVPEEKIALLAGQIEEVVANTRLEQPSVPDYNVDKRTGEVTGELEPMSVMVDMDEIKEKVTALADLNADNEIMLSAIRGRVLRRPAVAELEQKGCVGENRKGLLQCLGKEWCGPDDDLRNRAAYIVLSENRDRRTVSQQVVEANGLGNSALGRVSEIFREQIYKKAWAGAPLQLSDGTWERK
ncbi:MAG: DUF1318 domain-containing protein [Candidatus Lindowbacteria bacterium]|nr:DUF1318 domain-containing protein [Candidatus Lindowbacteria bacterium]